MFKQKQFLIIFSIILSIFLSSCGIGGDNDNTNIKDNTKTDSVNTTKNKDVVYIEPEINVGSENDKKLSDIEAEINKEREEKEKAYNEKVNIIKNTVSEYFNDINKDGSIIKYIDPKSIMKIKKNTQLVYSTFSDKEKKEFINELKEYGYTKNTFDPTKTSDINEYINFIVKGGFKQTGSIKKIEFDNFNTLDDVTSVDVKIIYMNNKKKTNKLFLNKENKIMISN